MLEIKDIPVYQNALLCNLTVTNSKGLCHYLDRKIRSISVVSNSVVWKGTVLKVLREKNAK